MANFPPQLTDLQQEVWTLLAEANNTPIADLRSGTGAAAIATTATNTTLFLNESAEDFCRTCYSLRDTATYASLAAGTRFVQFAPPTSPPTLAKYGYLWNARAVTYAGVRLKSLNTTALETQFPTWQTDANGTPLYWYPQGTDGIGIYPPPSGSSSNLVVAGLALPIRLSGSTDVSPIAPDMMKAIVWAAASRIAYLSFQDQSVIGRAQTWWEMYRAFAEARLSQIYEQDAQFALATFPRPGTLPSAPAPQMARASSDLQ